MTVYIEYVLIDNFVIDYLILKATFKITGNPAKKSRLFLSAFFGAFFALIFPLIDFNAYLTVIIKIASALIILLIANGYQTNKSYYVTSVIFLSLTFALGGAVIGVYSILNLDYSNELSIAFMILPVYLFIKVIMELINYFFSRSKEESYFVTCTLYAENESLTLRGFIDSGNSLYYGNKPVIVIDKKDFLKYFKCQLIFKNVKWLNYKTSAGESKMPLFLLKKIVVKKGKSEKEFFSVYLGVGETGEKRLLLSPYFSGESNENKRDIKKVN